MQTQKAEIVISAQFFSIWCCFMLFLVRFKDKIEIYVFVHWPRETFSFSFSFILVALIVLGRRVSFSFFFNYYLCLYYLRAYLMDQNISIIFPLPRQPYGVQNFDILYLTVTKVYNTKFILDSRERFIPRIYIYLYIYIFIFCFRLESTRLNEAQIQKNFYLHNFTRLVPLSSFSQVYPIRGLCT